MKSVDPYAAEELHDSSFGHATTQFLPFDTNGSPHGYHAQASPNPPPAIGRSWYDPRGWSLRKRLIVAACIVVVIIAVIVGAVEGVKANAYPNYSSLNYTLVNTMSGSSFFDNFEYYTAADPTNGFVQYAMPRCSMT